MPNASSLPLFPTRLELHKIGSDPEALFIKLPEGHAVPATTYVGTRRQLQSWIGTDGCSTIAELRPRPTRNVWLHIRDIAEALSVVDQAVCRKDPTVTMVAQPYHEGGQASLGGHIHMSFTLHDPIAAPVILHGLVWNIAGTELRSVPTRTQAHIDLRYSLAFQKYQHSVADGQAFGFNYLANKLRTFIGPLETLHPALRRRSRTYGNSEDAIRAEFGARAISPGVVRWRVEYRYPSTWLAHPALALAYLGLAKLALNNYHLPPIHPTPPTLAFLPAYVEETMRGTGAVVTDDVQHLPRILRFVLAEVQSRLQEPHVRVDFEAWSSFLTDGKFK